MEDQRLTNRHLAETTERSEEVQDIIERMPVRFGYWVAGIVLFLSVLLVVFGWLIRYPDVVYGSAVINANTAPIRLVANNAGKLHLRLKDSQSPVQEGEVIAWIENVTPYDTLQMVKTLLQSFDPGKETAVYLPGSFPEKISLGQLTEKYYVFINSLHQLENFRSDRLYEKKISSLQMLLKEQEYEITNTAEKLKISISNLAHAYKLFRRDSLLYTEKVLSEGEFDKVQMNYLMIRNNLQNTYSAEINSRKEVQQTQSLINETEIQKTEKAKELRLAAITTFTDLNDNISAWEEKYVIKSPFKGNVQFLKFWTSGQYVQEGEQLFTVIPGEEEPYAQVLLPAAGAGKVKVGQEVMLKLDDYPYREYGAVKGTISSISLSTKTEKSKEGDMEAYLLTVKLTEGMKSTYGIQLNARQESRGAAEVITNDRRLIQRFFGNLKYMLHQ